MNDGRAFLYKHEQIAKQDGSEIQVFVKNIIERVFKCLAEQSN